MKYKVEITRTTYDGKSFVVEAESEEAAHELAVEMACNTEWGTGNVEYEVDYMEKVDEDE